MIQRKQMLQRTQLNVDSFFKEVDERPATDDPPTGQSHKISRNDDSSPSISVCFFNDFIREGLFIVFTKEKLFMYFKFTCTVYKC
jgi:hypothetical protein